jgi:hypothetical protein
LGHNITYLFGAGASYNAVPIVEEFPTAIGEFIQITKSRLANIKSKQKADVIEGVNTFIKNMEELIVISNDYKTIDTYARKLALTESECTLHDLKVTLSIFFELWQNWSKRQEYFPSEANDYIVNSKDYIDKRYTTLFSNLLINENKKIKLPDNVNFLTWNYDTQIAKALNLFLDFNGLADVYAHFDFYPQINKSVSGDSKKIICLNGIAGLYEIVKSKSVNSLMDRIDQDHEFEEAIAELIFIYNRSEREEINFHNTFSFAWEQTTIAQTARTKAKEIMQKTNVLVVIGYSFPGFNLSVDRELLDAFKEKGNYVIYYQDKNPSKDIIRDSFNIPENHIILNNDVSQFLIPRQYL